MQTEPQPGLARKVPRAWRWILLVALAFAAVFGASLAFAIYRAEPMLRARIIQTLSARFHGPVELASLHVSVRGGLRVSGKGLKIFGPDDPDPQKPGIQPLLATDEFSFSGNVFDLLRSSMRIHRVFLRGLELNIPPREQRQKDGGWRDGRIEIRVDEFVCDKAQLIINTLRPDKMPLDFAIHNLQMQDIGPGQPLHFNATLVNPKPVGEIQSSGFFGPWQPDDVRSTPVRGEYSFQNADLSTIKGIGGILASTGNYHGSLGDIVVDGKTDTPDFRITISNRPVPLHTEFHATVDGTTGNTYLESVNAKLLASSFVAKGSVVRVADPAGHEIVLDVVAQHGKIDDFLKVAVRTDPPVMTGNAGFRAEMHLPPGTGDVISRLQLTGNFELSDVQFTNDKLQARIDALSKRSQGKPQLINDKSGETVQSEMDGNFTLRDSLLSLSRLHYSVPGANIFMTGKYSLDGNEFDFHGKADLDAKVSQMVTGWKSVLLKPIDPFFRKNGETEVPIRVTGTRSEPHFGLDLHH